MDWNEARRRLDDERARLAALRTRQRQEVQELDDMAVTQELDAGDDHIGDRAFYVTQREQESAIDTELEELEAQVERAIERLEEGTYDQCEVCGRDIDPERHEARPTATRCVEHA